MKTPSILSVVALVVGVAALASSLLGRASAGRPEVAPAAAVASSPDDFLARRMEALTQENRALRDRLAALELRPVPDLSSRAPVTTNAEDPVTQEEFDAFRDEVREALAGGKALAAELTTGPEGFRDQVAESLTEILRDEAADKVRTWQEERLERLDETMPKVETWLELTPSQSDQMRSALLAQYDREAELTRRWEAGEDPVVLGELKLSDREAHLAQLELFLAPAQFESYSVSGDSGGK